MQHLPEEIDNNMPFAEGAKYAIMKEVTTVLISHKLDYIQSLAILSQLIHNIMLHIDYSPEEAQKFLNKIGSYYKLRRLDPNYGKNIK